MLYLDVCLPSFYCLSTSHSIHLLLLFEEKISQKCFYVRVESENTPVIIVSFPLIHPLSSIPPPSHPIFSPLKRENQLLLLLLPYYITVVQSVHCVKGLLIALECFLSVHRSLTRTHSAGGPTTAPTLPLHCVVCARIRRAFLASMSTSFCNPFPTVWCQKEAATRSYQHMPKRAF